MADFVATLWREFGAETQEHLEAVEPILLAAESGTPASAGEVALLFRAFHSLKGLARSMDLYGMERLAHAAESLLSLVRDGLAPLDAGLVAALLPAVDALKALRLLALGERRDQPPPEAVLNTLEQTHERLAGGAPLPGLEPIATAGTSVAGSSVAEPAAEPEPEPGRTVRDDPEMLGIFADLLRGALPVLTHIVAADFAKPEVLAETLDAIERIGHAAETMGYLALVEHMRGLNAIVAAAEGRQLYPDARKSALRLLGQIGEVLKEIEGNGGAPVPGDGEAPISDLRRILGRAFEDELRETYCNAVQALSLFSNEAEGPQSAFDNDEMLAEEVAGMARLLYSFVLFLDWRRAGDVMLVIEDIFSRVAAREVFLSAETIALTRSALSTVFATVVDRNRLPEHWSDITPEVAGQLTQDFRTSLHNTLDPARASLAPFKVGQRFLATLEIKPALLEMLSPENIAQIMDLVQLGYHHLYEVLANPEKSPELTRAFLAWTESQVKPITNRSVFIEGETWFEFLMASVDAPEAVAARVAEIDPTGSFIQLSPCGPRSETAPAAPAAAVPGATLPGAEPAKPATVAPPHAEPLMRVRGEAIDGILNQIGEMISLNGALSLTMQESMVASALQSLRRGLAMLSDGGERPEAEALIGIVDVLHQYVDRMRGIESSYATALSRLQEGVLDLRVVPVDAVFGRFPRLVRDLAQQLGKQVRLEIDGGSVRIDKGLVEALGDPLMHMVRNAIDHGIEPPERRRLAGKPVPATVSLRAWRQGNRIMIEVRDDGAGLDIGTVRRIAVERGLVGATDAALLGEREVCRFIFQPGFSTAAAITATSGRGVGMDVVWTNVNRLGGTIDVDSETGKGTAFTLSLPLSAAIQSALIVSADGNVMAIPERFLAETCHVSTAEIQTVRGQSAIVLRDQFLPVFALTRLLGHPGAADMPARFPVVVIENGRQRIGLIVDRLYRRQDLFVKDIHPQLAAIPGVGGASTLGDGRVILILDGDDLFRLAEASVRIEADGIGLA